MLTFFGGRASVGEDAVAVPTVYEGWAGMPMSMSAIACCGEDEDHAGGQSYLAHVGHWRDLRAGSDRSWHEGSEPAPCFNDAGTPFQARIGVVETKPDGRIGTDLIAWLECL